MWYDSLIVMGMFALRLLVPIVLTIAVGYWLEKRLGLEQPEIIELQESEAPRVARGEGAMQIGPAVPCWEVKGCSLSARADCPGYARPSIPCWLAKELAYGELDKACPSCDQYKSRFEEAGRGGLRVIKGGQNSGSRTATTG